VRGPRFRGNADDESHDSLHGQLLRDIGQLITGRASRPDLLVVTGDLTESGLPDEFRRATEWLVRAAEAAGIPMAL
jgi:3',5'-cyclic AMP phosphodiesterase CpdA